jgi:glucose-6-phosphate 1-epimerase
MNHEQLNATHGIAGNLRFVTGKSGFTLIEIDNGMARALISPYAGQVLSYCRAGEPEDLLFVSEQAYFRSGKAIKGGIPICWPWFGADPEGKGRPAHGFVRNRDWQVLGTAMQGDHTISLRLGVTPDEEIRALWPHPFALTLEITVGRTLELALCSFNPDTQPVASACWDWKGSPTSTRWTAARPGSRRGPSPSPVKWTEFIPASAASC